jgi:hypothetical protein
MPKVLPVMPPTTESGEHVIKLELDPQRGGWIARCSCGWEAKFPHWYKDSAKRDGHDHIERMIEDGAK